MVGSAGELKEPGHHVNSPRLTGISLGKKVDKLSGEHSCYNQLCVGAKSPENSAQTVCSKRTRNSGIIANVSPFWSLAQMHWISSPWT